MSVIIVLSDCPPKLRGDMTKWLFEINTGVYVGNISARVREKLWDRITENIGSGHATMVFSAPGEQRLDFKVHNAYWEPVDFDGIKLMRRPETLRASTEGNIKSGFSKASRQGIVKNGKRKSENYDIFIASSYVVLDFETTGLDSKNDEIIEIAAILVDRDQIAEQMQVLVKCKRSLPEGIVQLTGLSNNVLDKTGEPFEKAVKRLMNFAEDLPFVCHNAPFEQSFLMEACNRIGEAVENRFIDTLQMAQILIPNLESYKLSSLADYLNINYPIRHRALPDCEVTNQLYCKLKEIVLLKNS